MPKVSHHFGMTLCGVTINHDKTVSISFYEGWTDDGGLEHPKVTVGINELADLRDWLNRQDLEVPVPPIPQDFDPTGPH